jgi:phosphoglycolate phosphatase-like HAD superfamily hydrolase
MRLIDTKEMALSKSKGQLFPKVIDVLESLHRDYEALATCTNGEPEHAGTIIDSQGIRHFFDVVRCRANELDNKPAMVAEIIGNLGLTEGVVTGDRREGRGGCEAQLAPRQWALAMAMAQKMN